MSCFLIYFKALDLLGGRALKFFVTDFNLPDLFERGKLAVDLGNGALDLRINVLLGFSCKEIVVGHHHGGDDLFAGVVCAGENHRLQDSGHGGNIFFHLLGEYVLSLA